MSDPAAELNDRQQQGARSCGSAPGLVDLMMCSAVVGMFVWEAVEVALHLNAILNRRQQQRQ